ncbi:hypothetical protein PIB30_066333 [Stylosanthes scabra]|uniref:Uncharacterized protein n=1 Tax=Stylosanthes scabra TaxID=79078 RepID=A0ABU6RML5_9FABA|nr:hypothetical protein [Stylosanthes scabra]
MKVRRKAFPSIIFRLCTAAKVPLESDTPVPVARPITAAVMERVRHPRQQLHQPQQIQGEKKKRNMNNRYLSHNLSSIFRPNKFNLGKIFMTREFGKEKQDLMFQEVKDMRLAQQLNAENIYGLKSSYDRHCMTMTDKFNAVHRHIGAASTNWGQGQSLQSKDKPNES